MESVILGIKVVIRKEKQDVILIVDNNNPIKVNSWFLKKATSLDSYEYEMLVGQKIIYSFFEPGEVFNDIGDICEYSNSLIKSLDVKFETSFTEFYKSNFSKRFPFEKITGVKRSDKKEYIDIETSGNNIYKVNISHSITEFTWKFFLLEGCYILSLDKNRPQTINENLLLRLPSSFFQKISQIDDNQIWNLTGFYYHIINTYDYHSDAGRFRYTREDYINDALGGQEDASWNLD